MKDKSLKEIAKKVVDSNYFVLIAVWIIMCIVFTKLQSNFFSYRNMLNILTSGSLVGLLCIGEAYLIIAGMIELSAGAVAAFSGVLAAILARDGLPLGAILPITIAGGLLFGLLNGLLVTKIKLQPFITTLATMSIARGLAYIICQVKPVRIANESLNAVGSLQVLTVPLPVLILVLLVIFAYYVTIPLLLIGLFFGFRYRFSGPELERDSINDVMENVASTAADMGRQVMDELHLQYEKRTRDRDGKE